MTINFLDKWIAAVRALLAEELSWPEKQKNRLLLIRLCLRRRNAESINAVKERLGKGLNNIQRIFFTESGVFSACLLVMVACWGTVGEGVVPFLFSSGLKVLLLDSVFSCVSMIRLERTTERRRGRYVKTMWLALFAWAMLNLLFTVVEIPARCGEEVASVLNIVMVCGFVATVAVIMTIGGIVNICRRRGIEFAKLKMLEGAMHFLVRPVKFVWKLAQKKGKIRMMFILAACICGTVDVQTYAPLQMNNELFMATTMLKIFLFVLLLGWALNLADRGQIVHINLESTKNCIGGANWCYEVLGTVALVNLLTSFPVQKAWGFLVLCVVANLLINLGCAVREAMAPADEENVKDTMYEEPKEDDD